MNPEQWAAVDNYIADRIVPQDAALTQAQTDSVAAGLPTISVSATQGKFLHLLAQTQGARRILEMGTLGGYSTIWLARALPPGGSLVSLEIEPKHADVARTNVARAGLAKIVDIRLGAAMDSLKKMELEKEAPFDFVFIDADKQNIPEYVKSALNLTRKGSVIVVDNVVRKGKLVDPASDDASVQGVRRMHDYLSTEPRISATTIQTVGAKGYDGFTLIRVL